MMTRSSVALTRNRRDEAPLEGRTRARIAITLAPKVLDGPELQRTNEPVTLGVPFPRGLCPNTTALGLVDQSGAPRTLQARALECWPDGSVRWALLDFQASATAGEHPQYDLVVDDAAARQPVAGARVSVTTRGDAVLVDTGAARFSIRPRGRFPFDDLTVGGHRIVDALRSGLHVQSSDGEELTTLVERVRVEEVGALRSVVLCQGTVHGARAAARLELVVRLHFFAGSATVRIALTIRNPERADHPGGHWTLGSGGSVYLRNVSLHIAFAGGDRAVAVQCSADRHGSYDPHEAPFELYQESSGGEQWNSANHRNRHGVVPHKLQGYRVQAGCAEYRGLRASPVVSLSRGDRTMAIALPQFWQNFPKAIEASRDGLTLGLFPRQYPDVHELQGGEQKTHTFYLAFDRDRVTDVPLDWCRTPLLARAAPEWYCAAGAVGYLTPATDPHTAYTGLVQAAIEGTDTFERKREAIDEYGWRHFGDMYADHEAVFAHEATPLISHYNNQYDAIAGFAYQFFRSADTRWWTLMEELAAHVVDIDTYHAGSDKAAYNHGLFWHTYHYMDAGTAAHRSYPDDPKVNGGGPAAEHNYSTGLLLHYLLTGDPLSRDTAVDLAQWVVDMDDGRKTIFRWVDGGPSGLASASGSPLYHGPGRAAGNSIAALLNGHRLTGEARFLEKAEELVRRCIHPADDLAARNLLDAERRWYYTVFLQALGKYLDYKASIGSIDASYAYARASLLHYAEWMAAHEYPYLERPEILEYPTETWAAQDMRKSDVFAFAAKYSVGSARTRFRERSSFFFESSVSTLAGMPTRTLTRPVTLMLTNGLMQSGFSPEREAPPPVPDDTVHFGPPASFVPQKVRAMARLRLIAAAGGAVLAATAAALFALFS